MQLGASLGRICNWKRLRLVLCTQRTLWTKMTKYCSLMHCHLRATKSTFTPKDPPQRKSPATTESPMASLQFRCRHRRQIKCVSNVAKVVTAQHDQLYSERGAISIYENKIWTLKHRNTSKFWDKHGKAAVLRQQQENRGSVRYLYKTLGPPKQERGSTTLYLRLKAQASAYDMALTLY